MEKAVLDFEQQKKRIEDNLEYIKNNLPKMDTPIFVELTGTPKSGKTTSLAHLKHYLHVMILQLKQDKKQLNIIQ